MEPGKHNAKITDYGISSTQSGKPQVFIKFNNGLTWYGTFKKNDGEPNQVTFKTLITCGFKGTDIMALADGPSGGVLNTDKELELVVENEVYNGQERQKIKFINDPSMGMQNKLDRSGAAKVMGGENFAGELLKMRQEMGVKDEPNESSNKGREELQSGKNDDVPF